MFNRVGRRDVQTDLCFYKLTRASGRRGGVLARVKAKEKGVHSIQDGARGPEGAGCSGGWCSADLMTGALQMFGEWIATSRGWEGE